MANYGGGGAGGGMGPARRRQLGLTLPGEWTLQQLQAVNALRRLQGQRALGGPAMRGAIPVAHPAMPAAGPPSPFPLPHPVMVPPTVGIPEAQPGLSGGPAGGFLPGGIAALLAKLHAQTGRGGGARLIGPPVHQGPRLIGPPVVRPPRPRLPDAAPVVAALLAHHMTRATRQPRQRRAIAY